MRQLLFILGLLVSSAGGSVWAAGPTADPASAVRSVRVVSQVVVPGATVVVPVQLIAHGEENAVGLSLAFDPAVLTYQSMTLGAAAMDATLIRNEAQAAAGKLGVVVGRPAGAAFAAGAREVVKVTFRLTAAATEGTVADIRFADTPIPGQVVSVVAKALPAGYQPGTVTVTKPR